MFCVGPQVLVTIRDIWKNPCGLHPAAAYCCVGSWVAAGLSNVRSTGGDAGQVVTVHATNQHNVSREGSVTQTRDVWKGQ
jgi:hypothetical protein